jgi:hypothetical protein
MHGTYSSCSSYLCDAVLLINSKQFTAFEAYPKENTASENCSSLILATGRILITCTLIAVYMKTAF